MSEGALLLLALSALGFLWPRLLAWPLAALGLWLGLALLVRASRRVGGGTAALPASTDGLLRDSTGTT